MFFIQQIPNLDGLFEDLEDQVQFDRNQILSNDTIESLRNYTNAGLQNINYTGYISQINSIISTLNVNVVISELEVISDLFEAANEVSACMMEHNHSLIHTNLVITSVFSLFQTTLVAQTDMIIATIRRVNDTTIAEINNLTVSNSYFVAISPTINSELMYHLQRTLNVQIDFLSTTANGLDVSLK